MVEVAGSEEWFPKSQVCGWVSDTAEEGDIYEIEVTAWIARQKGIKCD